jgi:ABC-type nickel/cobalt efflux system permease component RcnA
MEDEKPKIKLGQLEWGVILALVMSAGTTLFSAGIVYGDVRSQEKRITAIELEDKATAPKLAAIEANVQFLVNRARDEDNRRGDK